MTLRNFFKSIIKGYQRHRQINETVKELQKLTNAELNDIGINRGDIYSIARQDADMNPNLKGWV